jgi:4-amino-4-deoxy-L-arabinose transferase-like glycosyltransferase
MLWGSWLVVSGLVFSLSGGVIHTYYTVALAPAIAALAAIGAGLAWRRREQVAARALLALGVVATAVCSTVLLGRTPSWEPWLTPVIAVTAGIAVVGLLMPARVARSLTAATAVVALVACLAGPVAYSAQTIGSAHTGSTPSAGPATSGFGSGGAGPGAGTTNSALVAALKSGASGYRWAAATSGSQSAATLELATGGVPVMAIGGFNNQGGNLSLAQFEAYVKAGDIHYYIASTGGMGGGAPTGGMSGSAPTGATGRGAAAGRHLTPPSIGSRGAPGGSTGRTGSPGGAAGSSSEITSWVKAHYRAVTIGGQTVYDLTQPLQS